MSTITENKGRRRSELAVMNVLMCLAVVFIHVSSEAVTSLTKPSAASMLVYIPWKLAAFAVPGFIFVSGMKQMLSSGRHGYWSYLGGRLKTIVLPYVVWNAVYYAVFCILGYYEFSPLFLLKTVIRGDLSAQFYFIIVIIQFYLLRPLWRVIVDRYHPMPVLGIALVVTLICNQYIPFWFADRLLFAYPVYWLAGCYAGKYADRFGETLRRFKAEVVGVFVFFAAALIFFTYLSFCGIVYFGFLGILMTAYSLAAICLVYLVCLYIPEVRPIKLLDKASFPIYLMHCLVLILTDSLIGAVSPKIDLMLKFVIVYGVSILLCVGYVLVKQMFTNKFKKPSDIKQ